MTYTGDAKPTRPKSDAYYERVYERIIGREPDRQAPARTYVYILQGGPFVKIGKADTPSYRLSILQCGCPYPLKVAWKLRIPQHLARAVEHDAHKRLHELRRAGEWFEADLATAKAAIKAAHDYIKEVIKTDLGRRLYPEKRYRRL